MHDLPVRLIRAGCLDPGLTQGLYHSLALSMTESSQDTVILCSSVSPYLSIGYHQIVDSVLNTRICKKLDLPIFRRRIGGGTTYQDHNQIFYQCIFHQSRVPGRTDKIYQMMLAAPIMVLKKLGLQGNLHSTNELEANGLRIAGIGGGRIGDAVVVVGNLLIDFNYHVMSQVWNVPNTYFRELALVTMQERVGSLKKLGCIKTTKSLEALLSKAYVECFNRPILESELSQEEIEKGRRTAKYLASGKFLSLHRPIYSFETMKSLKISAGVFIHNLRLKVKDDEVEIPVRVDKSIIKGFKSNIDQSQYYKDLLIGTSLSKWKDNSNSKKL